MEDTSRSQPVSTRLQQIAKQAVDAPGMVFTTLAHHMDFPLLLEAWRLLQKGKAPGIDRITTQDYGRNLEANLRALHERLRTGRYRATPVKRVYIPKADGKKRPLGLPIVEDKIVQRAVSMLIGAVYEQDFYDFSYGYREKRSALDAIRDLRDHCVKLKISWVIDADIRGFFDTIDHRMLVDIIRKRINDGALIKLIGKWLHVGVLEGGLLTQSDAGTPQGGVISPVLANIFLHHVLDQWFVDVVKPRMRGKCFLIRYADDFVIGFTDERDAHRIMDVLPKRFNRFGLTIHPTKTRLVDFRRPTGKDGRGSGTFDFLGFTHYWALSRQGSWVIKRKTALQKWKASRRKFWEWCRKNRHEPFQDQYRTLRKTLSGYFQYYKIRCNFRMIERAYRWAVRAWHYWLSRRSSKAYIRWDRFWNILKRKPLPKPKIIHAF